MRRQSSPSLAPLVIRPTNDCCRPKIGIGGCLAAPPLPHHLAYGSVPRRFDRVKLGRAYRFGGDRASRSSCCAAPVGPTGVPFPFSVFDASRNGTAHVPARLGGAGGPRPHINSVGNAQMVNPHFVGGRPTMFICGNDANAKLVVTQFLDQFGWDTEDMGAVEAARAISPPLQKSVQAGWRGPRASP